ncbi:MAG: hypothetical protein RBG13Loki_3371 [Promethearchaeota archaeon CR_4]|nr:MAG: hypothetical protein RBG13Loki_3371 [Candidatus Lokiarchaeota archaeon CR_4]
MDKADEERFFETFKSIIDSVVAEKRQNPKWQKTLDSFNATVQFKLRIDKDTYFLCHLVANGGNYEMKKGPVKKFDLELAATPEDLMNFANRTYSTTTMIMKKNVHGQKRLQIKKGGRNLGKLLTLSKLLVLE